MPEQIELACGVVISLDCIVQHRTYAGLLAGPPTRERNARLIEQAIASAEQRLPMGGEPHVIPPAERRLAPRARGVRDAVEIPVITCLATFVARGHTRAPEAHFSSLKLVWFQDHFALPIAAGVLEQLKALDWPSLATDGYW